MDEQSLQVTTKSSNSRYAHVYISNVTKRKKHPRRYDLKYLTIDAVPKLKRKFEKELQNVEQTLKIYNELNPKLQESMNQIYTELNKISTLIQEMSDDVSSKLRHQISVSEIVDINNRYQEELKAGISKLLNNFLNKIVMLKIKKNDVNADIRQLDKDQYLIAVG
ncbi:hypothetical protein RF11_02882 [Thelohanellus kitauei]|uniref:Uncharacterized protein n=1 Tax=Thelohanellus kitauei TaxID=669202 RepID=A0A0C2JPX5_THEKT|nr:hypothetical protein RF11_02882 [Thelohanellus kitauei]